MTGTLASILRAPAIDWPDELARERTHHPEPIMPDSITVTLTRAEADAVRSILSRTGLATPDPVATWTMEREDARAALAKLERATQGRAA